jgi:hypothetical protein
MLDITYAHMSQLEAYLLSCIHPSVTIYEQVHATDVNGEGGGGRISA